MGRHTVAADMVWFPLIINAVIQTWPLDECSNCISFLIYHASLASKTKACASTAVPKPMEGEQHRHEQVSEEATAANEDRTSMTPAGLCLAQGRKARAGRLQGRRVRVDGGRREAWGCGEVDSAD